MFQSSRLVRCASINGEHIDVSIVVLIIGAGKKFMIVIEKHKEVGMRTPSTSTGGQQNYYKFIS